MGRGRGINAPYLFNRYPGEKWTGFSFAIIFSCIHVDVIYDVYKAFPPRQQSKFDMCIRRETLRTQSKDSELITHPLKLRDPTTEDSFASAEIFDAIVYIQT